MRKTLLALVLILLPALAFAQAETTGRVSGTVTDEQGKPIANAEVALVSPALQGERTVRTDSSGKYLATLLPPGVYSLTVESTGMSLAQYTFRVGLGQHIPLDVTLRAGERVTEEVTVYAPAARMETTATGENFNYETQINELPVIDRNLERVAELAPNISFGPTPGTLSISGAPSFDTNVLLDGAEVSDPYFGSAPVVYIEEALEEVQVLTGGVSARYGRFQGGVINATTKSGGNTFDGSARVDLDKGTWNDKTPYSNETQSDELNKVYSATVSGPIIKDRLTFFAGGRTIPTSEQIGSTVVSGQQFATTTDQDRWQIKLTGSVTPNHVIEGSYLDFTQTTANRAGLPAADLRALGVREDPRETQTLEYNGILSDRLSLNVQGTRKRVAIISGGDASKGSPFIENLGGGFQVWNNHWWDAGDPSDRDNDTLGASLTQSLATGEWGDHTFEYGVQYVNSKTAGENRQSSTGFNLLMYDASSPVEEFNSDVAAGVPGADPNNPLFNLFSYYDGGFTYRWEALALGGGQELKNTAVYAQDTWEIGKWRLDAGLRWESYDGEGPEPTLNLDFDELSPRLGVTYNMENDWQLQASWGKYVSRFNDNVASSITGVGGAPYIFTVYTGPTTCGSADDAASYCLTYNDLETILRDDSNWNLVATITDPTQPTRFLAPGSSAPYANDLNLAVKRALPGNKGSFSITYTDREFKNLLDDFVGDFGDVTITDPKGSGASFTLDRTVWANSTFARRDYRALTAAFDYRPSARWNMGGNWTYSTTEGNYEGEGRNTPSSGSIIGDYPRSVSQNLAAPYGYTDDDIRHRVRLWGGYNWDFGRVGNLSLGSVGIYQSGLPYSRTGGVAFADDPVYINEVGSAYTVFPEGRNTQRFNGFWRMDLSTKYQYTFAKDFSGFIKLNIINATNNDELIQHQTSGGVTVVDGLISWAPSGTCGGPGEPSGPSESCSSFGRIRNQFDYQTPRSYVINVGLEW